MRGCKGCCSVNDMKTASQVAQKYAERASAASGDYVDGARTTTKDQAAAAIAAADIHKAATTAALNAGRYAAGLQKSGKAKWLKGVTEKGGNRYGEGVAGAASIYATESGRFDSARSAASSLPRGIKGSAQNIARVTAVVNALVKAKTG